MWKMMSLSTSPSWEAVPEPVLVMICKVLSCKDILNCSAVCKRWHEICQYDVLWRFLFCRDFKLSRNCAKLVHKPSDKVIRTWKSEYERVTDTVPCVKLQCLKRHKDEVLHVAFAHSGNEFVSCSKDHRMIVWRRRGLYSEEYVFHHEHDMADYGWLHTWAAQYSPDDFRLMVAGVVDQVSGELAIFSTDSYVLLCRVINDPYDVFGCWCSATHFLSGSLITDETTFDASIWLCGTSNLPVREEALSSYVARVRDNQVPSLRRPLSLSAYKNRLFRFRNMHGTVYVRYLQVHSRSRYDPDEVNWDTVDQIVQDPDDWNPNAGLGEVAWPRAFEVDTAPTEDDEGDEPLDEQLFEDKNFCIIFMCGERTSVPHQIGFLRITADTLKTTKRLKAPEKVIDFHGHVIGLCQSPTGDRLYVNVRTWPENATVRPDQLLPIASQIEMKEVDLRTLTVVTDKVLSGHCGYTPTEKAFYLYIDVSEDFVGSGSECSRGFLWERHYGVAASKLRGHRACVNAVVMNPKDQQVCVTASDDFTLQVWVSKKRARVLRLS